MEERVILVMKLLKLIFKVVDKMYSELEPALSKCKEEGRSYMSVENCSSDVEGADELCVYVVCVRVVMTTTMACRARYALS